MRLYALPHEALHVLALLLIGRRPEAVAARHVDIPADLTRGQFVFVAGLPAFVFVIMAAVGLTGMALAATWGQVALGVVVGIVGMIGVAGTWGDVQLIAARLNQPE